MVDTHYDLLSICYTCYLKNDYSKIKNISEEIKNSGVKCIFANLYFMSKEEMIKELDSNYYNENVSILEMFKISKEILEQYLPDIDFVYSIEGCDYLNIDELDDLYSEGLRSIVLVWNNKNKYGSGNRTNGGITKEGIDFLNKAIDLGIAIDLSHANKNTFYGMIEVIKENQKQGKNVICFASHSNSKALCDRNRNLDDKQLLAIKEVDGLIGLFSNRNFVTNNYEMSKQEQQKEYLKHIIYISKIIGVDSIMLSTDDMRFCSDIDYEYAELPIFNYNDIKEEIENLLLTSFSIDDTNKIMYKNAYNKIISKLNYNKNVNKRK